MKRSEVRIGITTGDQDGIGPEVTAKALYKIGPQRNVHFFLWRSPQFPKKYLRLIDKKFRRVVYTTWADALKGGVGSHKEIADICSTTAPPLWVDSAAQAATYGHLEALVTAPLSKTLIQDSGLKDIGHTDILSRVTGAKELFMTFLGKHFNVLLVTGHRPLSQVPALLTERRLTTALLAAHSMSGHLKKKGANKIGLLGLNPHAGEAGLIGSEETSIFEPLIARMQNDKFPIEGPLVPDAAFLQKNWSRYSFFVCPYHDQGLIPFKMAHQHKSGCHLTLGLPFIRTSVEHGTAKDIAGKNIADPSSMVSALDWAVNLSREQFSANAFLQGEGFA